MANPYSPPTLTSYNLNPPPDDGSQVEANRVQWNDDVIGKVGDPLRVFAQAVDTAVLTAFGRIMFNGVSAQSANFTVATSEQGTVFSVTGNTTVTLPAAATAGSNFAIAVHKADATNTVTIDGNSTETIDGTETITLTRQFEAVVLVSNGTSWTSVGRLPTGLLTAVDDYLNGMEISNNTSDQNNDVDIAPGQAANSTNVILIDISSTITKRLDAAFAEGSGNGGLDTGSKAANTDYFLYAIAKADGTSDGLFSTSSSSPTLPTDFTVFRLLGSVRTDGSSNIVNNRVILFGRDTWGPWNQVDLTNGGANDTNSWDINITAAIDQGHNEFEFAGRDLSPTANGSTLGVQLGDAGGIENTGYDGGVGAPDGLDNSDRFLLTGTIYFDAGEDCHTWFRLAILEGNVYQFRGELFCGPANSQLLVSIGSKTLSDSGTTVRLLTSSANFDAGTLYWRSRESP